MPSLHALRLAPTAHAAACVAAVQQAAKKAARKKRKKHRRTRARASHLKRTPERSGEGKKETTGLQVSLVFSQLSLGRPGTRDTKYVRSNNTEYSVILRILIIGVSSGGQMRPVLPTPWASPLCRSGYVITHGATHNNTICLHSGDNQSRREIRASTGRSCHWWWPAWGEAPIMLNRSRPPCSIHSFDGAPCCKSLMVRTSVTSTGASATTNHRPRATAAGAATAQGMHEVTT